MIWYNDKPKKSIMYFTTGKKEAIIDTVQTSTTVQKKKEEVICQLIWDQYELTTPESNRYGIRNIT